MTHKQWFNNVLHLHPVHEDGATILVYPSLQFRCISGNRKFCVMHLEKSRAILFLHLTRTQVSNLRPLAPSLYEQASKLSTTLILKYPRYWAAFLMVQGDWKLPRPGFGSFFEGSLLAALCEGRDTTDDYLELKKRTVSRDCLSFNCVSPS